MITHLPRRPSATIVEALLAVGLLTNPRLARSDWLPNGTPVSTDGKTSGWDAATTPDGAGGMIVAFWASATSSSPSHIFAQRFDGSGTALWGGHGAPVCTAADGQAFPAACSDGAGGAIVAWMDYRPAAGRSQIYVQRLIASGVPLWTSDGVLVPPSSTGDQGYPLLAPDGQGGAIIVWQALNPVDSGLPGSTERLLFASRVDGSGSLLWGGPVQISGSDSQVEALIPEDDGGAIVVWDHFDVELAEVHVFAQRLGGTGTLLWPADGVQVDHGQVAQGADATTDGAGGVIVVWSRFYQNNVAAQRLDASGVPQWGSSDVTVTSTYPGDPQPAIASDGVGGAFVAWKDNRGGVWNLYMNRLDAAGSLLWGPGGVRPCTSAGARSDPVLIPDGLGGVIAAFTDSRGADPDLYASRVSPAGSLLWAASGVPVCTAPSPPFTGSGRAVGTGDGGAILSWTDTQDIQQVRAMRILSDGSLPPLTAAILSVDDVPNDQGGWVRLHVSAAAADPGGTSFVTGYNVWRQIPAAALPAPSASIEASTTSDVRDLVTCSEHESVRLSPAQAAAAGLPLGSWESLGFHAATLSPAYVFAEPTLADATRRASNDEAFVVTTHTTQPGYYTVSNVGVGHSSDNIKPAAPKSLAGTFVPSATLRLIWAPNVESDLLGYAVYRGQDASFVPSEANLMASPEGPAWTDDAFTAPFFYKVSAIDSSGNESDFATLGPQQLLGLPTATCPAMSFLSACVPNPMTSAGTVEYGLRREGVVRLDVFDLGGRLVRVLVDATQPAGTYRVRWDGAGNRGQRLGSGVYLVRMRTCEFSANRKVVLGD